MHMMPASSSFTATQLKKCDVYISFRGTDTRNNFTSHLHAALRRRKIKTFIDNQLIRGDQISSSLLSTIEASKISVIIFSEDYASSRWCLRELEQILEFNKTEYHIVIPVFHHVHPSDVRNQTGDFGSGFAKLEECFREDLGILHRWRNALHEAASLSGWLIDDETPESQLVENIVDDIAQRLDELSTGYDVFLSFSGIDTRKSFTNHLYNALKQERINVFLDDNGLERGKPIAELFQAIEQSRFSIIVFSKNYASSTWCLDELVKIVECMEAGEHTVLPVFYDVKPSVVEKQEGEYEKYFVYHERENKEKVQNWRNAMRKVANLSGWDVKDRYESEVIQQLVTAICRENL